MSSNSKIIVERIIFFFGSLTIGVSLCILIIITISLLAIFGPLIVPYGEAQIISDDSFLPPSSEMWLGGDNLGRDIFTRIVYALRITLSVSISITILAFLTGSAFGFIAAAKGGYIDNILSRLNDVLLSFPSLLIALIVITSLGNSMIVLIITVALIDSTRVFRIARALGTTIIVQDYIEAAKVRGEKLGWIIWHEMLPNALTPMAAEFGIRFTYAILFISALGFLGLGIQPPNADLGKMVQENMQGLTYGEFSPLYPAFCISIITISVNVIVDWYLKSTSAPIPDELKSNG